MRFGKAEGKPGFSFQGSAAPVETPPPPGAAPKPPRALVHCSYPWGQEDISAAGTSPAAMVQNPGGAVAFKLGRPMPAPGEAVSLSLLLSADVGGAGKAYTVELYISALDDSRVYAAFAATGLTATVTGDTGTERYAVDTSGGVGFNQGDILACYEARTSTPAAVRAWVEVGVHWAEEG